MSDERLTNPGDERRATQSGGVAVKTQTEVTETTFTSSEPDFSGTSLGGYKLVRKLAEGGMGVVYEAIQTRLDRRVALKVLTEKLSARSEFLKRFEREAKAAAALNHPNVVQVYDYGESSGRYYIVMEFVEGEDLAEYVQRCGKLSVADALDFTEQAAEALKAAHAKAIIHRDIKPSNLMLTRDRRVKVSDLGLAKILTEESDVTVTGVGMGSPHFIAPEQADDSRHVDHRVDIYSLGISLLYLVTGKKPFDGSTPFSVVLAHVNKPLPSGRDLGTDLPPAVETLIRNMAAKRPDDRYQDYASLIADIQKVRRQETISTIAMAEIPVEKIPAPTPTPQSVPFKPIENPTREFTAAPTATAFTRSMKPALITVSVAVFAALVAVATFAFLMSRHGNATQKAAAPLTGTPNRVAAVPRSDGQGQVELQNFRSRPEQDFGGQGPGPDDFGGGRRPDPVHDLLAPIVEIVNPLTDGPVADMFAAAEAYAQSNPENYRDILARFEQVGVKAENTPFEAKVKAALSEWTGRRNAAVTKAFKEYKERVNQLLKEKGHREAMSILWDFPPQLRSPEIDQRIVGEVAVPPPSEMRQGARRGPPPHGQPGQ